MNSPPVTPRLAYGFGPSEGSVAQSISGPWWRALCSRAMRFDIWERHEREVVYVRSRRCG